MVGKSRANEPRRGVRNVLAAAAVVALVAAVAVPGPTEPAHAQRGVGTVAGKVTVIKDGEPKDDHSKVAVYLDDVPRDDPEPGETHTIRQKDRSFVPKVSVVTVGTEVRFPNNDMIYHNVFSLSRAARFDLGLYRAGASRSATVDRPGVVDVYCNIHSGMHAKIKVLDTKHYGVTDERGRFRIANVPAGTYPLTAWQAWGDDEEREVTITPGKTTRLSIRLVEEDREERHMRKDGTPYGRYR